MSWLCCWLCNCTLHVKVILHWKGFTEYKLCLGKDWRNNRSGGGSQRALYTNSALVNFFHVMNWLRSGYSEKKNSKCGPAVGVSLSVCLPFQSSSLLWETYSLLLGNSSSPTWTRGPKETDVTEAWPQATGWHTPEEPVSMSLGRRGWSSGRCPPGERACCWWLRPPGWKETKHKWGR